jgi:hypothetical protein
LVRDAFSLWGILPFLYFPHGKINRLFAFVQQSQYGEPC